MQVEVQDYSFDVCVSSGLPWGQVGLTNQQYDVLRLSYGLDQDHKWPATDIAKHLNINVATANVRISQIKKDAIDTLIASTDPSQVLDFL